MADWQHPKYLKKGKGPSAVNVTSHVRFAVHMHYAGGRALRNVRSAQEVRDQLSPEQQLQYLPAFWRLMAQWEKVEEAKAALENLKDFVEGGVFEDGQVNEDRAVEMVEGAKLALEWFKEASANTIAAIEKALAKAPKA